MPTAKTTMLPSNNARSQKVLATAPIRRRPLLYACGRLLSVSDRLFETSAGPPGRTGGIQDYGIRLGRAKLAIGRGVSVWVLDAPDGFGDPHVHSHHAIQITLGELDAGLLLPLVANLESTFEYALGSANLLAAGERVVAALVPPVPARLPNPRIQRVIDRATSHLDESLLASAEPTGV